MWRRVANLALPVIVATYLLVGLAYARVTPPWEVPDEPAHYNYIKYLAEYGRLPILQMGDYPHDYLEEIKAKKFPPDMSVDPIRYEFHQPPLYYLLGLPIYFAAKALPLAQQVLVLRLLSLALGALLLLVAYKVIKGIFPDNEFLALSGVAFVATVPMHLAMSAAINNDTLAELILALVIWLALATINSGLTRPKTLLFGLLLSAALLTKTTIYAPTIAAILITFLYVQRVHKGQPLVRYLGLMLLLAALLTSWWFLRNALVYGGLDVFGWGRHDAIVTGQPTTAQWIAQYGTMGVIQLFLSTSFRSFWAQFGWMGILIDSRIYQLLLGISLAVALGLVILSATRPPRLSSHQKWALGLLGTVLILVLASFVWYNFKFVQHQGRYLFPAIIPLGLLFALGLEGWARALARLTSVLFDIKEGGILSYWHAFILGVLYLGFLALDLVCLYGFILPYFSSR